VAVEAVAAEVAHLTVIYDSQCPLCRRCRRWVEAQPQLVPFRFLAATEPGVRAWLGGLVPVGDDLVVIDDGGRAWVGPDAFVVCLWGLSGHRSLAIRLQQWAGGRLLAKHVFHSVSSGRGVISWFVPDRNCDAGSCVS
jgi:predicted DCC family thiol-disulfide oxidoreductase YuxK